MGMIREIPKTRSNLASSTISKPIKPKLMSKDSFIRCVFGCVCVREREKAARYLDALGQFLNEVHMLIKYRLQTEDFLSSKKKKR